MAERQLLLWEDDVMMRKKITFRTFPEVKEILLGEPATTQQRKKDRHDRLCEMATIIPEIDIPDIRHRKLVAFNIAIPMALDTVIRRMMEQTGQPYVQILLAATEEYRRRNPSQPAVAAATAAQHRGLTHFRLHARHD